MRLIDADLLKEKILKWLTPRADEDRYIDADDAIVSTMMEIDEQPTAYDVDKVVEQLQKEKNPIYRTDGSLMGERKNIDIDKAIKIVKGGGIG